MISKIILLLLLTFCTGYTQSYAQTQWKIKNSRITFKIKNAGFNVEGSFQNLQADIRFDEANYKVASIQATVDAQTIQTGIQARDKHLRKEDYFHVEKYPKITLKSLRFAFSQSGDWLGYFQLTLKGVSKEIKMPFTFNTSENTAKFEGYFMINRRDFGVGPGSLILSDTVKMEIKVEAEK